MHESDFYAAMRADPDDDLVRLAYADWLDERADPKAEFVRLSVEASKLHPLDADYLLTHALAERQFNEHVRSSVEDESVFAATTHYRGMPFYSLSGRQILEGELPADALGSVRKTGAQLAEHTDFRSLAALGMNHNAGKTEDFRALLEGASVSNLHALSVTKQKAHAFLMTALLKSPPAKLSRLRLHELPVTAAEWKRLFRSEFVREQATSLELSEASGGGLGEACARKFRADRLRDLSLVSWGWVALPEDVLTRAELPALRSLRLSHHARSAAALGRLLPQFPTLETLTMACERWETESFHTPPALARLSLAPPEGAAEFEQIARGLPSETLEQLSALSLVGSYLSDVDPELLLRRVAGSSRLETLSLTNMHLTRGCLKLLADPRHFPALRRLDVLSCRLDDLSDIRLDDERLPSLTELRYHIGRGNRASLPEVAHFFRLDRLQVYCGPALAADHQFLRGLRLPLLRCFCSQFASFAFTPEQLPNLALLTVPRHMAFSEVDAWSAPEHHTTLTHTPLESRGDYRSPFPF